MIERNHLKALRIAAQRALDADQQGNFESARVAYDQVAAIRELEISRQDIFARYNVSDLDINDDINEDSKHTQEITGCESISAEISELMNPFFLQDLSFGDILRRLRAFEGLSQADLSKRTGLDQSYLSRIERGKYKVPKIITGKRIIGAFGWDIDDWKSKIILNKIQEVRLPR